MILKTLTLLLLVLLYSQSLYAKKTTNVDFLLKANEQTSFMHYEFHNLAYEAAEKNDFENAYRIYLKLSKKGDDRAEYNIGMMYMKGLGVDKGKMDAYKWLRRASKHGNEEASLYFQKMNERYAKKVEEPRVKVKKEPKEKPVKKVIKEKAVPNKAVASSALIKVDSKSSAKPSPKASPSAIDQFLGSMVRNCNPTQKQSEIRKCDESGLQSSNRPLPRRFERDLAVLFKPPPVNVKAKFKRDLAKVEQLTSELKYLDEMIGSAGVESEFLRQQQRQLTDEIHRIDSEYQEINLLDVLGSGIKVVKKGYEAMRDKQ